MVVVERILCLVLGYAFGLIQTGYFVGKIKNVDLTRKGSGNSGATNALRTMGWGAGIATFAGDFLKGVLAVLLVKLLFVRPNPDLVMIFSLYTALGVVLGHNFPFYLNFRGGKGIAATAGALLATDWRLMIIPCITFIMITFLTRYVSVASLTLLVIILAEVIMFGQMGELNGSDAYLVETYIMTAILAAMGFWRHRGNISRLLKGRENPI